MKNMNSLALLVSLIVLVGFPILFLFVSLYTGDWRYLMWSLPPSFLAGFTGLILTLQTIKKEKSLSK
ncbi:MULTISPECIES: hypothetical protein [Rossellomorea]|uniref:hypothetical protein n=1 Tax=Rossellomorea TaxID=2837508 RepID=UPI001CC9103F|nr:MULTISPECIES: hypothetical protein [Rossellomorea]MCA0149506.1 hypothetical protein [Rossellomorea vietnamensis]UTE78641.1 hypothetical protein M1J35_07745 [Rossellomorea sp. KS-H15a]WGG46691.1 hypothetical protein P8596_05560 [Rossellomorea sp. DA94]WQI97677.1 hypothetical protein Q7C14_09950 [Rossellomorea vietnamensis]